MSDTAPASRMVSPGRAAALLALAIFLLGTNWPVLKIVMHSITPLWFTTLRMASAGIVFFALLAARGKLIVPARQDMPMVLVLGLCQFGIMSAFAILGVSIVGAGRSSMLVYTNTMWMALGAILFMGEKPPRPQIAGLICGLVGLAVLFSPFGMDWTSRRILIGNGAVILGAIFWAYSLLRVRGHRWAADPIQLMPYQMVLGSAVTLPFAVIIEGPVPQIAWTWEFVISYTSVLILATCVSFLSLVIAARSLPAIAVSLGQLATPVIGVVCSAFMVAEIPSWDDIIGLTLIVGGVAFGAVFGRRRAVKAPAPAG